MQISTPSPRSFASELSSGAQQATQEEMAVLNQASDAGSADAGSAPAAGGGNSVSLGMSVDQVRGILGNMRLVVTDHHLALAPGGSPPQLAPADAVVNPKLPGSTCSYTARKRSCLSANWW